jgi:hypothetical protein
MLAPQHLMLPSVSSAQANSDPMATQPQPRASPQHIALDAGVQTRSTAPTNVLNPVRWESHNLTPSREHSLGNPQQLALVSGSERVTRAAILDRLPVVVQPDYGTYQPPIVGLRVGDTLSSAAKVIGTNFVPLVVLASICLMPAAALDLALKLLPFEGLAQSIGEDMAPGQYGWLAPFLSLGVFVLLLQTVLTYVSEGAVMLLTVEYLAGRRASLADSLRKTLERLLVIVVAAFLQGLLTGIGMVFCLVPGFIVACALFVSVPAAVAEKTGPIESLRRSAALTEGSRVTIFLLFLIFLAIAFTLSGVVSISQLPAEMAPEAANSLPFTLFAFAVQWGTQVLQTIVLAVLAAVVYARLRAIRDGIDAEALARVFA